MEISKYSLFINRSFDNYTFNIPTNNSIFEVVSDNMTFNSLWLVLSTKPENNTSSLIVNINDVIPVYIFPTTNTNVSFGVGELIQTVDNDAIFIITNYIEDNKFALRLVSCKNNTNYTLYNTSQSLIYNSKLDDKQFSLNTNKTKVMDQWANYTTILNSSNLLSSFLSSQLTFITNYTSDYTVGFNFSTIAADYTLISNIIDKFYLNIQAYDYNDYKYIYGRDILTGVNDTNYKLTSTNNVIGVIKTANTKIIPHNVFKLTKNTSYSFTDTTLNKYTSYARNYTGEKVIIILQLSLKDKSITYDIRNNVESDSIFVII